MFHQCIELPHYPICKGRNPLPLPLIYVWLHQSVFHCDISGTCPEPLLDRVDLDVHFETSSVIGQLGTHNVLKQVPDSVELHDVLRLALQPELVELCEEVTGTKRVSPLGAIVSQAGRIDLGFRLQNKDWFRSTFIKT